jgi:hypothetical protein
MGLCVTASCFMEKYNLKRSHNLLLSSSLISLAYLDAVLGVESGEGVEN